jgi:ketosteroid isomerase-like protein
LEFGICLRFGAWNLVLLLPLLLMACQQNVNVAAEEDKLLQTDMDFARFSEDSGAAPAFKKYLTEDALMLPAGSNPLSGRDTIYAIMRSGDGKYVLKWEPQEAHVAKSGELGWTWGKYIREVKSEQGGITKSYGKYLNVWIKESDGSWRVRVDMGNKSPDE